MLVMRNYRRTQRFDPQPSHIPLIVHASSPIIVLLKLNYVKIREVAQLGSAPALGAGGRWFESSLPDQAIR